MPAEELLRQQCFIKDRSLHAFRTGIPYVYKGGEKYYIFILRKLSIFRTEYISQQLFTFSLKPAIPESENTVMANSAVWQVLHFLCILAHIGMIAVGAATFVVNAVTNFGDVNGGDHMTDVIYPWAVGGIVSCSLITQQLSSLSRYAFMSS